MRRAILALVSTVTGLVLLLTFKTHAVGVPAAAPVVASPAPATTPASPPRRTPAVSTTTVTGASVATPYGDVQVQVQVRAGRVVAVTPVHYPTSTPRDAQINAYAVPVLTREALAAGSARIDLVSGATFTSVGYIRSLQSALDRAGL